MRWNDDQTMKTQILVRMADWMGQSATFYWPLIEGALLMWRYPHKVLLTVHEKFQREIGLWWTFISKFRFVNWFGLSQRLQLFPATTGIIYTILFTTTFQTSHEYQGTQGFLKFLWLLECRSCMTCSWRHYQLSMVHIFLITSSIICTFVAIITINY